MSPDATLFDDGRPDVATTWPERPRHLMSYAYVSSHRMELCRQHNIDLAVDSGAFTTNASGKEMDHDAYLEWLRENSTDITFALSLDVIGDHDQSRVNHEYAEDKVGDLVKLVPTFHLGSPMSELERLCRAYDFVSIGGAVPFARQHRHLFTTLKQMHRVANENSTKLHGLGMTGNSIIHGFPWYSLDSSGWTSSARFPSLPLATADGRIEALEHGWKLEAWERDLVRQYGGDPDLVSTPGWSLQANVGQPAARDRREWTCGSSVRSYMYAEAYKNSTHPETPIRIYLSGNMGAIVDGHLGLIVRAWQAGSPWPVITTTPQEGITS